MEEEEEAIVATEGREQGLERELHQNYLKNSRPEGDRPTIGGDLSRREHLRQLETYATYAQMILFLTQC